MNYLTRNIALNVIRQYCSNKIGFEDAFARTTIFFIVHLMNCITNDIPLDRPTYDEALDFLDGNGFKVEGNDINGYTVSLLNN